MHTVPKLDGQSAGWPELALENDTGKARLLGLGSLAFTALGAGIVFFSGEPAWSRAWLAGWGALIFFPLGVVVWFKQATVRGPVLTIGPRGVRDVRLSPDWIPWHAIARASASSAKGVEFIMLEVAPEFEKAIALKSHVRLAQPANAAMGYRGLWINSVGLAGNFDDVKAAIASGLARVRSG